MRDSWVAMNVLTRNGTCLLMEASQALLIPGGWDAYEAPRGGPRRLKLWRETGGRANRYQRRTRVDGCHRERASGGDPVEIGSVGDHE